MNLGTSESIIFLDILYIYGIILEIYTFMNYKKLTYILFGYLLTLNSIVFAGPVPDEQNITKPGYKIFLDKMDPLNGNHDLSTTSYEFPTGK